jgi:hypothetical protein
LVREHPALCSGQDRARGPSGVDASSERDSRRPARWISSKSQELWGEKVPRPLRRLEVQLMAPLFDEGGRDLVIVGGEGWSGTDEPDRLNSWVLEVLERDDKVPKKIRSFVGGHGDVFMWATLASDLTVTGLLTDPDVARIPRFLRNGPRSYLRASTAFGCRARSPGGRPSLPKAAAGIGSSASRTYQWRTTASIRASTPGFRHSTRCRLVTRPEALPSHLRHRRHQSLTVDSSTPVHVVEALRDRAGL